MGINLGLKEIEQREAGIPWEAEVSGEHEAVEAAEETHAAGQVSQ